MIQNPFRFVDLDDTTGLPPTPWRAILWNNFCSEFYYRVEALSRIPEKYPMGIPTECRPDRWTFWDRPFAQRFLSATQFISSSNY